MRIDNIYKSLATNQASPTIGRGHVNGLYINSDSQEWRLTVRLRNAQGTRVLVPNMELWRFTFITDFLFGAGGEAVSVLANCINTLFAQHAGLVNPSQNAIDGMRNENGGYLFRIDLGSIYLSDGDELVIDFTNAAACKLHVSTFSDARTPHELVTYEQVKDANATYNKVQAIFVHGGNRINPYDTDVSYKVTDSYDTFMSDQVGVVTATRLLGKFENLYASDLGLLWSNTTTIPDTVSVQITGADATDITLVIVRKEFIQASTSASTLQEAKKKIARVRTLEQKDPETAKALRHAGLIEGKSVQMEARVEQAEEASKDDKAQ